VIKILCIMSPDGVMQGFVSNIRKGLVKYKLLLKAQVTGYLLDAGGACIELSRSVKYRAKQ